ncbi:hypothetical protein [Hasllibacter sp. MH4015]|uniref:glycine-rich domain-containing protein n=1 Tax=Hasllibacter sp. MH4015 TaxID=2854029 RepID=UPI001CD5C019|nr:hypothetical protein [Hasllibacter sp. MH4015]
MRNPELWARLTDFAFDKGHGSAPYSVKLARAEGWSAAFTARVIEEYRRFLYLTQVSDRQVTPSRIIDAAWHMHLTFTRDYWEDLCPNVIGRPVHHQPCAGEEEMPRYRDQFAATKALYEAEFGIEPPADIWGRDDATVRRRRRRLVQDETGAGVASPVFITLALFLVSLYLVMTDPTPILVILTAVTGVAFLFVLLTPRRRRRNRRERMERDGEVWFGENGDGGSRGGRGRRDGNDDRSTSGSADKKTSGGFAAWFFGDDSGGGNDGGGCGGCGGD